MKRKVCSFILVLVVLLLALSVSAFAYGEKQTAEVPVKIVLEGPLPDPAETFTVQLTAVTADAPMPSGASGGVYKESITGAGSLTLKMDYDKLGVYEYSLKQLPGDKSFCTYSTEEYSVKVYVINNESNNKWTWVLRMYDSQGTKVNVATFTNVYDPLKPAELDPPLEKKVENKRGTAPSDTVFTFAMVPSPKDAPMPDPDKSGAYVYDAATGEQRKDHKGTGSFEFGIMRYDQDDVGNTYVYTIKEVKRSDKGYTYDAEIYTMTVKVSSKDGAVALDVSYTNKSGQSVDKAVFTNVYDGGGGGTSPQTGDDTNWWPWALALVLSGCTLAADAVIRRKKNSDRG